MKTLLSVLLVCLTLLPASLFAQSSAYITIAGEVTRPLKLTANDLDKFPSSEIKSKDRDGKEHVYKGALLSTVLDSAGVTLGKQLRGENLAKYILVKAADGYEVVFALPEIDPEFTSQNVLLVTSMDGSPLPKGMGPFRIVAPQDKKQARWIREVVSIKVAFAKD